MNNNYPKYIDEIMINLCKENKIAQEKGFGPFAAAICNENGEVLVSENNSVINDNSSLCHAEINAIKSIQKQLSTYDLSAYNLSICITAEPCSMCAGAIMWSGIKNIYYGTPSNIVEKITGFDEGYKPNWEDYFTQKGITVAGAIQEKICTQLLQEYMNNGRTVYKPHN